MDISTDKVTSALALAGKGFRVFPLAPGSKKPPRDLAWKEVATADPVQVEKLWLDRPNANVGIATGDGILVIDVDVKGDRSGDESLGLLDAFGLDGESFRVSTPSGGTHVYLNTDHKHGQRVDTVEGFPGIDIRCDGGYVVGPGSEVDGKTYSVINDVPRIAAPWFDDILLKGHGSRSAKSEAPLIELDQLANIDRAREYLVNRAPEAVEGAGGDDATYRVATSCRDYGLSEGVALELMLEHWNEQKASPPWMPDELEAKVSNAFQYASGSWGGQTAEAEFGALDIDVGESPVKRYQRETDANFRAMLVNAASLSGKPIVDRPWLVPGLVPAGTVTLLSGDGGTGKSLLALMLAVATATDRPWLGRTVKAGACLYFSAEDDADEIHRRLADIQAASFGELADLTNLEILDLAGKNAVLGRLAASRSEIEPTELFKCLREWAAAKRPRLIVLDTLADIFAGDEIIRTQARQFVGLLKQLAIESGAAVLVLAHPSLQGMASGEGTSGSTAWSNSVRSRLYFERVKEKGGTEIDADRRVMRTKKANYGRIGDEIEMRWRDGVFTVTRAGDVDTLAAERRVELTFMQMLRTYTAEARSASDSHGSNYAPAIFERDKRAGGIKKAAFTLAMNRLFEKKAIAVHESGPPSKRRRNLVANVDVGAEYAEDFA